MLAESRTSPARRAWRVGQGVIVFLSFAAICLSMVMTVGDILVRMAAMVAEAFIGNRPRWGLFGLVDLTQLAMMVAVPLAVAAAFFSASHIRIDLFSTRMRPGMRRVTAALSALLGIGLMGICFWTSLGEMRGQFEFTTTSATLGIAYTWYWAPLLLGFALALLACAGALWLSVVRGQTTTEVVGDV